MNTLELVLFIITAGGLLAYARWLFKSWRTAALLTLAALVPLYLGIERVTQFLVIDGVGLLDETIYITTSSELPGIWFQWLGSLRTTDLIFGTLTLFRHRFLQSVDLQQWEMVLKGLHWLATFAVFMVSHALLHKRTIPEKARPVFFLLYISTALLLPTNALAMKTFTYDALSLALGVLGVILLYAAVEDQQPRTVLIAVFVSFFAAQEKMVISPLLLLALAVYGTVKTAQGPQKRRWLRLVGHVLTAAGLVLVISLAEAVMIGLLRHGAGLRDFILSAIDPINSWAWPVISLTFGSEFSQAYRPLLLAVSLTVMMGLAAAFLLLEKRIAALIKTLPALLSKINTGLLVAFVAVGLVGLFVVDAVLAPHVPIPDGYYVPNTTFNFVTHHYNTPTMAGHFAAHTAFFYAISLADLPVVFWLLALAAPVVPLITKKRTDPDLLTELLLLAGLLIPLLFGLAQMPYSTPPSARYVNIGMTFMTLGILIRFARTPVPEDGSWMLWRNGGAVFFALVLVLEVLPFAPLYGPFRPFWLNPPETDPQAGEIVPVWWGWGEELMQVASEADAQCGPDGDPGPWAGQDCEAIALHTVFQSRWLNADSPIQRSIYLFEPHTYTETDYYVINWTAVVLWGTDLPADVKPVMTLDYRGSVYAWVYRGSDLHAAGIEL